MWLEGSSLTSSPNLQVILSGQRSHAEPVLLRLGGYQDLH